LGSGLAGRAGLGPGLRPWRGLERWPGFGLGPAAPPGRRRRRLRRRREGGESL